MTGDIIDLSSNNTFPIDFGKAKASGIRAVLGKATEGTSYVNPYYTQIRDGARAVGLQFAAYHFAHFTDPYAEAAFFNSVAGADAKILDGETGTNTAWYDTFLAALNKPSAQEMSYGSASTLPRNINRGLLFPAAYGQNPNFGSCWQFTQTGIVPGVQGYVDVSEWTGTELQYEIFFGITAIQPSETEMIVVAHPTKGYWIVAPSGAVEAQGGANYFGGANGWVNAQGQKIQAGALITSAAATPSGNGYYLCDAKGEIYAFGDAHWAGNYK